MGRGCWPRLAGILGAAASRAGRRGSPGLSRTARLAMRELTALLDALGERLDREGLAEWTRAWRRVSPSWLLVRPEMNERSIFSASTGLWRCPARSSRCRSRRSPAHAERLDRDQSSRGVVGVAHQARLGDLQRERARLEPLCESASRTSLTSSSVSSWRAETLMACRPDTRPRAIWRPAGRPLPAPTCRPLRSGRSPPVSE